MKHLFYGLTLLSIVTIIVGMVRFDNFRDRLYLLAMLLLFGAIISGIMYLIEKHK